VTGPRHADRPEHVLHADQLEVVPGTQHETLQGWIPELANEDELREALEKAFDYRGDVAITRKDGSKIEGYIFDRAIGKNLTDSFIRLLPNNSKQRVKITYSEIAALAFTGRDTAAGKSWEAWVKKYWDKKEKGGESLTLQPESLEE
jgi:hypothetical protein